MHRAASAVPSIPRLSGGHASGAYMAREIVITFGVDSQLPATIDPAAFLRAFAAAERSAGRASPFGPEAMHVVGMLEQRYWSRGSASGCAAVFDFALTREVRCSPACRLPCKTM